MTTQKYQQASRHFLERARAELEAGDLPQASEKGWGAAAQMLKAIADQRGWEHSRHRHFLKIASRLRAQTGNSDIRRLFSVAETLHGNFYENELAEADISESLDEVGQLLDVLDPLVVESVGVQDSFSSDLDER